MTLTFHSTIDDDRFTLIIGNEFNLDVCLIYFFLVNIRA